MCRLTLRRRLGIVAFVYVVEGFPMGIFRDVWPIYLRDQGASLALIGALSGLSLAWSAKLLWSPLVDRFGSRLQWIAGALVAMAALLVAVPALDPSSATLLLVTVGVFCAASATQDVAIDAYTIGIIERGEEGLANAVRINAYRIALILSGGGLLLLPGRIGWTATHHVAAAAMLLMAVGALACPRVAVPDAARRDLWGAFRPWLRRGGLGRVLAFVLLYRLGDLAIGPMVRTFWRDRGLGHDEIALVSVTLGSVATMAGAALGGWWVSRAGIPRALLGVGLLAVGSNLAYAAVAAWPASGRPGIYAASVVESFCAGLAAAGFLSFLMRICQREHAAVQYATLTGLYALPGALAGGLSGAAVERMGYAAFFAATALLAAPAFAFLPSARRWAEQAEGPGRGGAAADPERR